ncbi:MAG: FAD-dependent oxidoreductase [Pseudonocardia sp.]|nr:FAD-dependent oxidoreductase [Pseudonocardia sp.]
MVQRICIVGGGISGLSAAWALHQRPDQFDIQVLEKEDRLGGNAITVDVPQRTGQSIPVDISVTACVVVAYPNYTELLRRYDVEMIPTRFSYSVHYGDGVYAHDFDSALRVELRGDIKRFRALLRFLGRFNALNAQPSVLLTSINPFNYVSMGRMLNLWRVSDNFRVKALKPLFVNFVLATSMFDMPASMFSRYLDFFDIEHSTPMTTWHGGMRVIIERMTADFRDRIHLGRAVSRIVRDRRGVTVHDIAGREERFDQVILSCNANHALGMLANPSIAERHVLGRVRYESSVHGSAVVHTDRSVLPDDDTKLSETRSTFVRHYGDRRDNYEVTYIMHNQQPWAKRSDRPCLVTYNPARPIEPDKVLTRVRFQHVVHDVFHTTVLLNIFPFLQGRRRTWYCGAHTAINSQEHCFLSGLAVARQLGADYPFSDNYEATRWFNFYGRLMHGPRFRCATFPRGSRHTVTRDDGSAR